MSRYQDATRNPQGPGDARPTALQIVKDENRTNSMAGMVTLITGGNQGIGLETARALHATGMTVFLGVRDSAKGQQAVNDILSSDPSNVSPVHFIEMQLDSLESIRTASKAFLARSDKLNILVLNAGIMAAPQAKTVDGFERQFGINHLGHFLLFELLKPALLNATFPDFHSRVVSLSSVGHRHSEINFDDINFEKEGSYQPWVAYGQAKTANIYFATEVERRYGQQGLHAIAVHPGAIMTNLGQYLGEEALQAVSSGPEMRSILKTPAQGAATSVFAALSREWEGRGGRYLCDCAEAGPVNPESATLEARDTGFAPWAYDSQKAAKLWKLSCELVGTKYAE